MVKQSNQVNKNSRRKILASSMGKRKPNINSPRYKVEPKLPKFQPNQNEELYLAVGSGVKINNQQRKSKLYSENRQLT